MLLQTFFNPTRMNATVHQLNVAPNHVKIPKSANKYNIPIINTAQLNQHGQLPSVHTIAFISFFFAIIIHLTLSFSTV